MNPVLVIARKEILDGLRDGRSLLATLFYALMGPIVVGLVSLATHASAKPGTGPDPLKSMIAIFTLVSAFVGGMNVAMDSVAGERERKSLLPLLLNPVSRRDIALGKWLAVSFFALLGIAVDVLGFTPLLVSTRVQFPAWPGLIAVALALASLPFLAASIQLWISTTTRLVKEAQTYLSLVVFLPMGVGMFLAFRPSAERAWFSVVPVVGQQLQMEAAINGHPTGMLSPLMAATLTIALSALFLRLTEGRLQQDEIIYGS